MQTAFWTHCGAAATTFLLRRVLFPWGELSSRTGRRGASRFRSLARGRPPGREAWILLRRSTSSADAPTSKAAPQERHQSSLGSTIPLGDAHVFLIRFDMIYIVGFQ